MSTTEELTLTTRPGEYTNAMIYGYGTAAVAIISSLSMLGILLFPVLKNRWHEYVLQFFIALGVGTMTADALIHIIPDVLGLHEHSEAGHEGETEEDTTIVVWKMSVIYGGIYFFFVLENGLKTWRRYRVVRSNVESNVELQSTHSSPLESKIGANVIENSPVVGDDEMLDNESIDSVSTAVKDDKICFGFSTVILTVGVGDALHNVTDGIAIGVSFAQSATAGIGTSIAVLFHEIPHEFGDFAIYLENGASKWQALGLNAIAACFAFIGLYFGISVSQNDIVRMWILAFVAGTFLYIALVQVTTEMTRHSCDSAGLQFFLQNLGLLLGWTLMLLLGLYEESIEESVA